MKRIFLLGFLAFFFSGSIYSSNVKITGTAPGAEGKIIHLYGCADFMTMLETQLDGQRVDALGAFELNAEINTTEYVTVSIDFHEGEFFIEPGKNYQLKISPINYNNTAELNPFIESQALEIEVTDGDSRGLNTLIGEFNSAYNEFVLKNFNDLYRNKDLVLLNSFREDILNRFSDTANDYFRDYVKYKFAGLEQVTQAAGTPQLMRKYFLGKPILYRNVEYMDFFNLYFQKYILAVSRPLKFIDYPGILEKADSYRNMMKALLADTSLKKENLRELVLLHGLAEMYATPGYKQEPVMNLITEISEKSKFSEHRIIAKDIITVIMRLRKGTPAPPFALPTSKGDTVRLSGLKGKPVIISFWTTYCQDCIRKLEMIKPLTDKYGEKVVFLSISADKSVSKMKLFLNLKKNFTWTFLHVGDAIDILKDYNVKSYPLFVIVDQNGMIYDSQAPLPGEGLEAEIEKLLNP